MENNNNIKRIPSSEFEYKEPVIYIEYIISNCHIEIKYFLPTNLEESKANVFQTMFFEYIKRKFENSFKDEKQIWEDYKYIIKKQIDLIISTDGFVILDSNELDSHFDSIYEDAKKVYERRNE